MEFEFQYQASESNLTGPFWSTRSSPQEQAAFISTAAVSSELVITRQGGQVRVTLVGPQTAARLTSVPTEAEFIGVPFLTGAFLEALPPHLAVDGGIELPLASARAFWLRGSAIPLPKPDELDGFVARLQRRGELAQDLTVQSVLRGLALPQSARTVQRQFQHATGLSFRKHQQIQRAAEAAQLLQTGHSIADVIALCGYSDQPHLTRALRLYWGQTPAQMRRVVSVQDLA